MQRYGNISMTVKGLLIGSIGVVAETSDIQRRAYNQALQEANVAWEWGRETYRELLKTSGGKQRLRRLSAEAGGVLSNDEIDAIHSRKTEIACAEVVNGIDLRPGLAALVDQAIEANMRLALVTSTYRPNIDAIAAGSGGLLPLDRFDAILTVDDSARSKPAPDIYHEALYRLSLQVDEAVAIEDSTSSVRAAKSAGIYTIAVPGEYTHGQDFSDADQVLESLEGLHVSSLRSL